MATSVTAPKSDTAAAAAAGSPATNDKRKRLIIGAAAGLVIVAAGAYIAIFSGGRKEEFAQRSLMQARQVAEQGNLAAAATEFQKVIQTYPGTDAASEAVVGLNQARMVNGQYQLAIVGLRDFLATDPKPEHATPAYGLLGAALENTGKYAEAAEAYESASRQASVAALKADFLLSSGRAHRLAGNPDAALTAYRTILEQYKETPSRTEAEVRAAEMTAGS